MLSIRTQKSITWFFFCGALSNLAFLIGLAVFLIVKGNDFDKYLRVIIRERFYWPTTIVLLLVTTIFLLRKLSRSEHTPIGRQLSLFDAIALVTGFSVATSIWVAVAKPSYLTTGLPTFSIVFSILIAGMLHSSRPGVNQNLARLLMGLGVGTGLLARLVLGGFVVAILSTAPFETYHRRRSIFSVEDWWMIVDEVFLEVRYFEHHWFYATSFIGALCAPLSLFFNWLARYSARNAKLQEI